MAYVPAPINAWDANLIPYLLAELNRISDEFQAIRDGNFLRLWNVAPPKPREGQIIAVDGTAWNPGKGAGIYSYTDGVWVQLGAVTFGDVVGGDYAAFEADGTLKFFGDATVWQDIDFPIIIRTTGANIPKLTTLQGNVTVPQWAIGDYSICEGQELVHAWKEGSEFQWHVHMLTNGLDATDRHVNWEIEWFWVSPNGVISSTITTTKEVLIPANTTSKTMIISEVGLSTIGAVIGGHIYARLHRIALVTGGLTNPTKNPWCTMLQLHIECDTVGSRERITK